MMLVVYCTPGVWLSSSSILWQAAIGPFERSGIGQL